MVHFSLFLAVEMTQKPIFIVVHEDHFPFESFHCRATCGVYVLHTQWEFPFELVWGRDVHTLSLSLTHTRSFPSGAIFSSCHRLPVHSLTHFHFQGPVAGRVGT